MFVCGGLACHLEPLTNRGCCFFERRAVCTCACVYLCVRAGGPENVHFVAVCAQPVPRRGLLAQDRNHNNPCRGRCICRRMCRDSCPTGRTLRCAALVQIYTPSFVSGLTAGPILCRLSFPVCGAAHARDFILDATEGWRVLYCMCAAAGAAVVCCALCSHPLLLSQGPPPSAVVQTCLGRCLDPAKQAVLGGGGGCLHGVSTAPCRVV